MIPGYPGTVKWRTIPGLNLIRHRSYTRYHNGSTRSRSSTTRPRSVACVECYHSVPRYKSRSYRPLMNKQLLYFRTEQYIVQYLVRSTGIPLEGLTSSHMYPSACKVATLTLSSNSPVTLFIKVGSSSAHLSCRFCCFFVVFFRFFFEHETEEKRSTLATDRQSDRPTDRRDTDGRDTTGRNTAGRDTD